ncbi:MAG TPA: 2-isopropylmalate synthase [Gemmatimonadaceae bacterium]
MSQSRIQIFDTTLRDGEQAPGCTMTLEEKLEVARQLARLGVDIIEAGFPAASPGDWEAVHTIAAEVGTSDGPIICGLARANEADIDRCGSATLGAARRRIHVFIATSDIHLEHKLRMSRAQVLEATASMVRYARGLCEDVEFSPEDASRSDPEFLHDVLRAAVESGATTLNIPDTVGYATPDEYAVLIRGVRERVVGDLDVTVSTHCHDDLGLAVANSLAGVRAGARQVECTVNGIGERAGNASLEEVVMALRTRRSYFGVESSVDSRELARTSRLVSSCTGVHVPPNKAIVGANAFAHEAGIHQDGVLKNRLTYEIMSAETVGLDGNILVLGKHSGRHAFRKHLSAMGYELDDEDLRHAFARFKEIADRKKILDERDIEAIVSGEARRPVTIYALEHAAVTCGTHLMPTAIVRLRGPDGKLRAGSAQGSGAVDAVCRTIQEIIEADDSDGASGGAELVEFSVNAITEGLDAVGEVTMRLKERTPAAEGRPSQRIAATGDRRAHVFTGYGVHTDVIMATAEAYIGALNKLLLARREREGKVPRHIGAMKDDVKEQQAAAR